MSVSTWLKEGLKGYSRYAPSQIWIFREPLIEVLQIVQQGNWWKWQLESVSSQQFFVRRLPKINKKLITCVHQKEMHSDGNHFPSDSEYYHRAGTHFRLGVISTPLNVAHYHSTITNCRFFWQSFSSRSSLLRDCSVAHSRSLAFDFRTQLVVRYN